MTFHTESRRVKLELLLNDYLRTLESLEKTREVSLEAFPILQSVIAPILQSIYTPSPEFNGVTFVDAIFLNKVADTLREINSLKE